MKRGLLAFLLIVFLSSSVFAADVAYIYRKDFKIDNNVLDVFSELNLSVELLKDTSLPVDFSQYKMIYVNDENFREHSLIPTHSKPSVISNYYHGYEFGLTDEEGVSQLGSTSPLSVEKNSFSIPVYTQAFKQNRIAIPYYFLDKENKIQDLVTVASAQTTSSGKDFGDVIAYIFPGLVLSNGNIQNSRLCFYGIVESDYWTPQARNMLKECIGHVLIEDIIECYSNLDCPTTIISEPYCKADDVYQNETSYTCVNPGEYDSECVESDSSVLIETCDYGCSNGECLPPVISCVEDSDCGKSGFLEEPICQKNNITQKYISYTCNNPNTTESFCSSEISNVTIEECTDSCSDGSCQEEINCYSDSDCGINGLFGEEYCSGNLVFKNRKTSICHNQGTTESFCTRNISQDTIDLCPFACSDGICITCDSTQDCDDSNSDTIDICNNPGQLDSYCSNDFPDNIICKTHEDCGTPEFISQPFCSLDDVNRLFRNWTCMNPNTEISYCVGTIEQKVTEECDDICLDGICTDSPSQHDISLVGFSNSIDGIRLEYPNGTDILHNELNCNEKFKISITVENKGEFNESVDFVGSIGSIDFNHLPIDVITPGEKKLKTKTVNLTLEEGFYEIMVEALIENDTNPEDNLATREVYISCPDTKEEVSKIVAHKIICESESNLPNWGNQSVVINESTALDFVNANPGCSFKSGWKFQYNLNPEDTNPEDGLGELDGDWVTFGPTGSDGKASVYIQELNTSKMWLREVFQSGYLEFSGQNTNKDFSAEMYCHKDVLYYDNHDRIDDPNINETYYCVAFNVPLMNITYTGFQHCDIGGPWGWRSYGLSCESGYNKVAGQCPEGSIRHGDLGCFYTGRNQGGPENPCWSFPHDQNDECCFFACTSI
jgi:hypothetical protein